MGFSLVATAGTARAIEQARIPVETIHKVLEGSPHVVDAMAKDEIHIVINTTEGARAIRDSYAIRRHALLANIPYFTTMAAALAAVEALEAWSLVPGRLPQVRSVQEWHARSAR